LSYLQVPAGASPEDWQVLSDSSASADMIGLSVANIICSVRLRLTLDSPIYSGTEAALFSSPGIALPPELNMGGQREAVTYQKEDRRERRIYAEKRKLPFQDMEGAKKDASSKFVAFK